MIIFLLNKLNLKVRGNSHIYQSTWVKEKLVAEVN